MKSHSYHVFRDTAVAKKLVPHTAVVVETGLGYYVAVAQTTLQNHFSAQNVERMKSVKPQRSGSGFLHLWSPTLYSFCTTKK